MCHKKSWDGFPLDKRVKPTLNKIADKTLLTDNTKLSQYLNPTPHASTISMKSKGLRIDLDIQVYLKTIFRFPYVH